MEVQLHFVLLAICVKIHTVLVTLQVLMVNADQPRYYRHHALQVHSGTVVQSKEIVVVPMRFVFSQICANLSLEPVLNFRCIDTNTFFELLSFFFFNEYNTLLQQSRFTDVNLMVWFSEPDGLRAASAKWT